MVQSNDVADTTFSGSDAKVELGAPKIFSGATGSNEHEGVETRLGSTRTYDPYWSNARAFLNFLSKSDLIVRDLNKANFGQFVLVSGKLVVTDTGSLKPLWGMQSVMEKIAEGSGAEDSQSTNRKSRHNKPAAQGSSFDVWKSKQPLEFRLAMDVIPFLPHLTLASIINEHRQTLWGSLVEEGLVGTTADLMLKHGPTISGAWTMLAVLDAKPDDSSAGVSDDDRESMGLTDEGLIVGLALNLSPVFRNLIGRPSAAFGVTPLLLFREIGQAGS